MPAPFENISPTYRFLTRLSHWITRGVIAALLVCPCFNLHAFAQRDVDSFTPTFYIAHDGSDEWSGRLARPSADNSDGPFATFEKAREAIRELKSSDDYDKTPIVVEVGSGLYELQDSFVLGQDDSGITKDAPVIWRATREGGVRLSAGRFLVGARKLDAGEAPPELKNEVNDKVIVIDLTNQGVANLGTPADSAELFFQGKPMTLARYPDHGFVKISDLFRDATTHEVSIHGAKGVAEGKFYFDDPELCACAGEEDLWVHGYWFWDWSEQKHRVASVDVDSKLLNVEEPYHHYGYRVGQWFYLFNSLRELDSPGEYYIDRKKGRLYFIPTTDDWQDGDFLLTQNNAVLRLEEVSHIVWSGFEMFGARNDVVWGRGYLNDVTIQCCDISNSGSGGISLVGNEITVAECELWNLGGSGISVGGGDRNELIASGNRVVENYVHEYARVRRVYAPGVTVSGVGAYVGHNFVENAPHMGMGFSGNDHIFEFNEICNVCYESNDAGAIYTGRNWTMRGNVLRNNYLHDIVGFQNNGCVGIYLDDMFSSADMIGNLFVNVTRAAFIGGGRDCKILGNVFVDCHPAIHIDARGAGWANGHIQGWLKEFHEKGTILGIKFNEPPYSTRYPELATILDEGKKPECPEGNVVADNVCIGGTWDVNRQGQWQGSTIEETAKPYVKLENNFVAAEDDGSFFVDALRNDYRFKDDSQPIQMGYDSLPVEQMGLTVPRMLKKAHKNAR